MEVKNGKYTEVIKFDSLSEVAEDMLMSLKIFGIEKVSVSENDLTLVGKGHQQLWKMVELDAGESLDDFEGIDDESKKIGHTFPLSKVSKIFETAFDFAGELCIYSPEKINYEASSESSMSKVENLRELGDEVAAISDNEEEIERWIRIAGEFGWLDLKAELENRLIDLE